MGLPTETPYSRNGYIWNARPGSALEMYNRHRGCIDHDHTRNPHPFLSRSGTRTRTRNNGSKNRCVTNYTIPDNHYLLTYPGHVRSHSGTRVTASYSRVVVRNATP